MRTDDQRVAAVVVAAGSGLRAGSGGPKQWRTLSGRPVVQWSLEALTGAGVAPLILVIRAEDERLALKAVGDLPGVRLAFGGETRSDSVRNGLAALAEDAPDLVLIHDAARPLLTTGVVQALTAALADAEGAAPALAVADTLKRADGDGRVTATVPREGLWQVQTPQAFRYADIVAAHAGAEGASDDLALIERRGGRVVLTPGDPRLLKLTYPEDFEMAERLAGAARITRVGLGFDAHRFGPGDGVWLCGVKVPSDRTLIGHSDADAGLHALTDAVLGAVGEGDIGDHFPPSDPKWRGAPSHLFLSHALGLVVARGGRLINVDVTLICERPKVKPHREAMRARLAEICGLALDRVSVKATTTEAMGFTGREEGLAAQAIAAVETPA
jgi:2-C-methyl-D-erythritol 4-phosphate cytidylyltransferase/2-C-methyl-D-erythritol 2,4-cyclodiphosphate synthase